jgi:hypothetical protein
MNNMSESMDGFDAPRLATWSAVKSFFRKLDRHLTAIAHAEAGNFDEVQKILDQNKAQAKR